MADPPDGSDPSTSGVETLRRIKQTEEENQKKLAELKARDEMELATLRAAADDDVLATRQREERAAEERLAQSRTATEVEAQAVVNEATREAEKVRSQPESEGAAAIDPVLDAVLGEFRPRPPRPEA